MNAESDVQKMAQIVQMMAAMPGGGEAAAQTAIAIGQLLSTAPTSSHAGIAAGALPTTARPSGVHASVRMTVVPDSTRESHL